MANNALIFAAVAGLVWWNRATLFGPKVDAPPAAVIAKKRGGRKRTARIPVQQPDRVQHSKPPSPQAAQVAANTAVQAQSLPAQTAAAPSPTISMPLTAAAAVAFIRRDTLLKAQSSGRAIPEGMTFGPARKVNGIWNVTISAMGESRELGVREGPNGSPYQGNPA